MIYLAPIQGFTDFVFRKAYALIFDDVDAYFIPYISVKNNQLLKKYIREVVPENNLQHKVIPQVLAKDANELLYLSKILEDYEYTEINLNLGCPYPMVTKRTKGAGLLPYPEKIKTILTRFFDKSTIGLSIKLRAGLLSPMEMEALIPILNDFPLSEVIFHPRVAKQIYSGEINDSVFEFAAKNLKHDLAYNGDIFSSADFNRKQLKFNTTENWMLGRGVLMNPFLPLETRNVFMEKDKKIEKLKDFQESVFEGYLASMDNDGNVLNKMKQFWSYFCYNFSEPKKAFKSIKKTKSLTEYREKARTLFWQLY